MMIIIIIIDPEKYFPRVISITVNMYGTSKSARGHFTLRFFTEVFMNQQLPTYILQLPRRPYFNRAHNTRRLIKSIGLLIMYFSAIFSGFITLMSGHQMLDSCHLHRYLNVGIDFTARILFSSNSITRGLIISLYFRSLTSSILSACHFLCSSIVDVDFNFLFLAFCF